MNGDPLTRRRFLKAVGTASAIALGVGLPGCVSGKTDILPKTTTSLTYTISGNVRTKFADFIPLPVTVSPSLKDYTVPAGLSGVVAAERAGLDDADKNRLASDLFFLRPSSDAQIYDLYKNAEKRGAPVVVTTDAVLHAYHILFDYALRILEVSKLSDAIVGLTDLMLAESLSQLDDGVPELQDLCMKNVAFFAVAKSLLGGSMTGLPADARQLAEAELRLIDAHEGFADSPVFGRKEDYSQYVPRGHYTRNEQLERYFRAMMWYGRMPFSLYKSLPGGRKEPDKESTRRAIMIVMALNGRAFDLWKTVYDPTVFFVGETDDLSVYDYQALIKKIYGDQIVLAALTDDDKVLAFIEKAAALKAPKIISGLIQDDEDKAVLKGFRFMGQRFIPDSYIFQGLVYDKVGTQAKPRAFPMGLDVMAVLGSERAYAILDSLGETEYANYVKQFEALKAGFAALKAEDWTQNLYWGWLYSLLALLNEKGDGYPTFMKREAWIDKELNTSLGSWTELRHDTILYAKQSYTVLATGMMPTAEAKGYVEPNPELYGRLASLAQMTFDGLEARGLLTDALSDRLVDLKEMLVQLKAIAEKELTGTGLTSDEYAYIRNFGNRLENITTFPPEVADAVESDTDKYMAVVADVHTDPNTGQALEEGVGYPYHLFVVVPIDGSLTLCQGAAFSYYEFKWPISDRLTDEKWQEMLSNKNAPEPPAWTKSFAA
ncbi:MAG: hypothetical protein A4E28_02868 [Methanocella sp. PtaU1.Bin125]|nr:MAG: hypothetical protein A4E28_02868 [Methanocella sp. PtaU1.Bin125]